MGFTACFRDNPTCTRADRLIKQGLLWSPTTLSVHSLVAVKLGS